jgi:hypothetical protein
MIFFLAFLSPVILVHPAVLVLPLGDRPEPIETLDSDEAGGRDFIPLQRQTGARVSEFLFLNMFSPHRLRWTATVIERDEVDLATR